MVIHDLSSHNKHFVHGAINSLILTTMITLFLTRGALKLQWTMLSCTMNRDVRETMNNVLLYYEQWCSWNNKQCYIVLWTVMFVKQWTMCSCTMDSDVLETINNVIVYYEQWWSCTMNSDVLETINNVILLYEQWCSWNNDVQGMTLNCILISFVTGSFFVLLCYEVGQSAFLHTQLYLSTNLDDILFVNVSGH